MKKYFFLFFLMSGFLSAQVKTGNLDSRLIGCWEGSEMGQYREGQGRHWRTCRFGNGTSNYVFTIVDESGKISVKNKTGTWWVENNVFYELFDNEVKLQTYEYEILGQSVRFRGANTSGAKVGSYIFMDHKIEN